jgi:hypothetical protein
VQDEVRVAQVFGHPGRANPPPPGRMSIRQHDHPHSTYLASPGWSYAAPAPVSVAARRPYPCPRGRPPRE